MQVLAAVQCRRRNSLPVIVGLSKEAKEQGTMEDGELDEGRGALQSELGDDFVHAVPQYCPQCDSVGFGEPLTTSEPTEPRLPLSGGTLPFLSPSTQNTLASFEARCSGIDSLIRQHSIVHSESARADPGL